MYINVDNCHPGYTVLVIIGVMVYWVIVIVTTFFLMLWFRRIKCNVGYLYGIVFYYSVVDVLLGQTVNNSSGLNSIVAIYGGTIFKLYPGFLFRVCFVEGMFAVDQYVIHYAHPTAVLMLIWLLTKVAKNSTNFTILIRKAAIPTICLILILAYVSIVLTSLQLLRHTNFAHTSAAYSYLSPSLKYFAGRHIAYFIIAVLFEIIIGVGLPLLLLLEPFLNRKINFTNINLRCTRIKLKPLLDQFQGCYKDRFRWVAGVYLLGRQVILIITVIDFANEYITQYLLMIVFVTIAILHFILQPYKSNALNRYDGIILQSLLLVVSLQTTAYSNRFTTEAITGIAYVLYFFPVLISLIFIGHYIYSMHHAAIKSRILVADKKMSVRTASISFHRK